MKSGFVTIQIICHSFDAGRNNQLMWRPLTTGRVLLFFRGDAYTWTCNPQISRDTLMNMRMMKT